MLPRVLLLAAVVIWGWTFVATKILVAEIGPIEIFALRLAISLPVLAAVLLVRRVPLRFARGDARILVLGGAVFTLHVLIQIAGLATTTASNTAWLVSVSPLALAILSFLFLRERIGWSGVGGITVATAGILLLVSRGDVMDLGWLRSSGDWLVLASAHTWALYTVVTRDLARRRNPLAVTFGIFLIAAAFTAILVAAAGDLSRARSLSPRAIVALLFLAIPGTAIGHWFWQEGVASLGAARAGLYLYLEPLATLMLAVPLLGEPLTRVVALGGGLVLAGVYIGQRERRAVASAALDGGGKPVPDRSDRPELPA
jgi:drug/metabolite transporter (DMT)-like permease